jgi:hypothetical protein
LAPEHQEIRATELADIIVPQSCDVVGAGVLKLYDAFFDAVDDPSVIFGGKSFSGDMVYTVRQRP